MKENREEKWKKSGRKIKNRFKLNNFYIFIQTHFICFFIIYELRKLKICKFFYYILFSFIFFTITKHENYFIFFPYYFLGSKRNLIFPKTKLSIVGFWDKI